MSIWLLYWTLTYFYLKSCLNKIQCIYSSPHYIVNNDQQYTSISRKVRLGLKNQWSEDGLINIPSGDATLRQRHIRAWRCIDVDVALYKRYVPIGYYNVTESSIHTNPSGVSTSRPEKILGHVWRIGQKWRNDPVIFKSRIPVNRNASLLFIIFHNEGFCKHCRCR